MLSGGCQPQHGGRAVWGQSSLNSPRLVALLLALYGGNYSDVAAHCAERDRRIPFAFKFMLSVLKYSFLASDVCFWMCSKVTWRVSSFRSLVCLKLRSINESGLLKVRSASPFTLGTFNAARLAHFVFAQHSERSGLFWTVTDANMRCYQIWIRDWLEVSLLDMSPLKSNSS